MESNHKWSCSIIHAISASPTWIDEDLMSEILKRLPVKVLCRFRSVCRSWNSLISSASFITLHSSFNSHSSTTPAHLQPYLRREDSRDYALCRPQDGHLRRPLFFPFRFRRNSSAFQFVGLIRGVICLSYSVKSGFDSTILWNPATHSYVAVPSSSVNPYLGLLDFKDSNILRGARYIIGCGYDSANNDFKVVRIWHRPLLPLAYQVFSTQQGIWRVAIADHIGFFHMHSWAGCFVNGTIHWLGWNGGYLALLFDCEREEFRTMEIPKEIHNSGAYAVKLLDYGGMLSVLVADDYDIELWVVDNDAAATWKKLYRFSEDANAIDIYESSYLKLAPYGPNEWIKFHEYDFFCTTVCSTHVYLESMFLMDDTKTRFYTNEEILYIDN